MKTPFGYAQAGHQKLYHILAGTWVSPEHRKSDPFAPRAYRFLDDSPNVALCTEPKGPRAGQPRRVSRPVGEPGPDAAVCQDCLEIFTRPDQPGPQPRHWEVLGGETVLRWHGQEVKAAWEAVSPEEAEKLLAVNKVNRKISRPQLSALIRDMANGDFVPNGATVVVYEDESAEALGDAQHRLTAITESGTTQPMLVVRGVRKNWLLTVDQGRSRTFLDAQHVAGITDSSSRAGRVARRMLLWDAGHHTIPAGIIKEPPSVTEIQSYYEDHRAEIAPALEDIYARSRACHMNETVFATVHILTHRADPDAAPEFMEALSAGAGLQPGDPVLALRAYLSWHSKENKFRGELERQRAFALKAWADRRDGKTVLRYKAPSVSGDPARYLEG